jgi:hypothetical protein
LKFDAAGRVPLGILGCHLEFCASGPRPAYHVNGIFLACRQVGLLIFISRPPVKHHHHHHHPLTRTNISIMLWRWRVAIKVKYKRILQDSPADSTEFYQGMSQKLLQLPFISAYTHVCCIGFGHVQSMRAWIQLGTTFSMADVKTDMMMMMFNDKCYRWTL